MKLLLAPLCAIGSAAATVPAAFGGAFASPSATATVDLGGDAWTLTNGSMTPVKATVPGQTHTDLLAGMILTWIHVLFCFLLFLCWPCG